MWGTASVPRPGGPVPRSALTSSVRRRTAATRRCSMQPLASRPSERLGWTRDKLLDARPDLPCGVSITSATFLPTSVVGLSDLMARSRESRAMPRVPVESWPVSDSRAARLHSRQVAQRPGPDFFSRWRRRSRTSRGALRPAGQASPASRLLLVDRIGAAGLPCAAISCRSLISASWTPRLVRRRPCA